MKKERKDSYLYNVLKRFLGHKLAMVGVPLGLLAGYLRGPVEMVIMRCADIFLSFLSMILILVLASVLGQSIVTVTVVIGVLGWPEFARLIYSSVCSVFFEEFIHDYTEEGDEYLQADLNDALRRIIPDHVRADQYRYPGEEHFKEVFGWPEEKIRAFLPNMKREELFNGDAHLRSTLIGSSITLDVEQSRIGAGLTGYVYFVDYDCTHSRRRTCKVAVLGNSIK